MDSENCCTDLSECLSFEARLTEKIEELERQLREAEAALEDMMWQFAFQGHRDAKRMVWTGGLSALETAFRVLGWDDPHFIDEGGCEYPGCIAWACCGTPTPDGYKRVCGEHFEMYQVMQREGE
jgi:hypothetical protein